MTTGRTQVFENMTVDYVEFYVDDLGRNLDWLVDGYGCTVRATSAADEQSPVRSYCVGQGDIDLLLTTPVESDHPAAAYIERHGDGVGNIGLRVPDAAAAFEAAVRGGARPVAAPAERDGVVTATILGFGDVTHTFVQRPDGSAAHASHGLTATSGGSRWPGSGLRRVDHFAVAVEPGQIDATVEYYQPALDFDLTLTERIEAGDQAMFIKVVQSKSRAVTLTLIESDTSMRPGHVDDFLKDHGGAGVQHMALSTTDILTSVRLLGERGVELLSTPDTYYDALAQRVQPDRHRVEDLRALNVLIDEDHDGQLYQIFAKSVHPRNTIFLEIIERAGASTFGSSNIKSLYEAVETQRNRSGN
jgi:4-hydroxymandelate synthase